MEKKKELSPELNTDEQVILCKTSYHYWRYWVSDVLKDTGAKFIKEDSGWNGSISVAKVNVENAKKQLADYIRKNPETKELWWELNFVSVG